MMRTLFVALFVSGLAGCTALPDWSLFAPAPAGSRNAPGHYNFAWHLSGDRAVAPAQVFDNGRRMWLQFAPEQTVPAIFERSPSGDRPLEFRREGPYVVLQDVWPHLVLRGGHLTSFVDRIVEQSIAGPIPIPSPAEAPETEAVTVAVAIEAAPVIDTDLAAAATPLADPQPVGLTHPYEVSPGDKNLRLALSRWARAAGWMFEAEHWAVDADIPIVGSARFEPEFRSAVQELMASTELADRPLQPCFYSNKVLRIVPYAQSCDRTVGAPESS